MWKPGKYGQGSSYFAAKNPDFGATFSWWLKRVPQTLLEKGRIKKRSCSKRRKNTATDGSRTQG
ncbi:MAG: hypothetical protein IPF68_15215 [Bacteroidales bacterium]|nr:hypothetical protein [Bacteroidales bacterium]